MNRDVIGLVLGDHASAEADHELGIGTDLAHEARVDLAAVATELLDSAGPGDQLALIPVQPKPLTDRQQAVLDALTAAGQDGLDTDQAGAIAHELKEGRWAHGRDDRCAYCAQDGKQILQRLADLGHARYRRANRAKSLPGIWLAMNPTTDLAEHAAASDAAFGEFPPGF